MSNIYIQEPATRGKVILETTVGDIEIELFSKECPLACRNFLQLCMDGYYDGNVFHRIVSNFIAQGGDPTGTGEGGESSTGAFFPDEFHTRLRYNRRGLVGMVNQGPNTNASQFFFTLGSTPELDKKNTLFGKVVGNTLFNMLKLGEGEIIGETPTHKHKIIKTEIITNPFDNMVPRPKPQVVDDDEENKKSKETVSAKAIKNYGLLSFGNEAEEDEEEITKISMKFKQKGTGKSAHDLTDDSTLSKSTVPLDKEDEQSDEELPVEKQTSNSKEKSDADFDKDELDRVRQKFNAKKIAKQDKKRVPVLDADDEDDEDDQQMNSSSKSNENVKLEIERLQRELKQMKKPSAIPKSSEDIVEEEKEATPPPPPPPPIKPVTADTSVLMDELMAGTRRNMKKNHASHSNSRESQTLDLLAKFKAKVHSAKDEPTSEPVNETEIEKVADKVQDQFLNHRFVSEALLDNVQDIYTNAELLTVYDPRNPMTKRRRDESSVSLHQKKHKGRT